MDILIPVIKYYANFGVKKEILWGMEDTRKADATEIYAGSLVL